ncbi:MAG TPA: EF-P lysine aminoacylase EpmA [Polyangiaceae bacterium]
MKPARVLAPSDLASAARPARKGRVKVGGRVLAVESSRLTLTDALGALLVHGEALACEPGDLVVVEGELHRGELHRARVVERAPCPTPRGDGAIARFTWEGVGTRLSARAVALAEIRRVFAERSFLEVQTPFRVRAPGVDANLDALRAEGGFLITSPELHLKRLLVGGLPRIFELARVARADERGVLHEPEFTLLEWYRAFSGQDEIQADTEAVVERVARALRGRPELVLADGRRIDVTPPFPRVTVREAFHRHARVRDASTLAQEDPDRYFELLVERVEPALARSEKPVFLCDYPVSEAALARPSPNDPTVAERFELYAGGVELSNGYGELTDPVEQERRFRAEHARRKAARRRTYPLDRKFLAALAEGMPPSGGNALGVDRLVMLALGGKRIEDVIAFPWAT